MRLSDPVGPRRSSAASITIGLVIGALLGGGIGYWLGRTSAPTPPATDPVTPAPTQAQPQADPTPATPQAPTLAPHPPATAPEPATLAEGERRISAAISGSLYATLARELEGRDADILSAQIGRLLVWWLDARKDVLRGDRVEVLYRPEAGPGQLRILALRYYSTKLDQTFEAYFHKPQGSTYGRYYDAQGVEVEKRLVESPVEEYEQITELMNMAGRRHHGIDFKVDVGTPVRTPLKAKVMRRNWNTRRNGNCLHLVYTKTGTTAMFLHLDEVLPETRPGKIVPAGTVVARTGNTGHSTAPHLHYELHDRSGRLLNPFEFHKTTRRKLQGPQLASFKHQLTGLRAKLQGAEGDSE